MRIKNLSLSFALVLSHALLFWAGYYSFYKMNQGDLSLSYVINDLSVLSYVENGRFTEASEFLRRQIEVNLATAVNNGMADTGNEAAGIWIDRYMQFYNKYPQLDHPYDPEIRKIIDSLYER